METKTLLCPVCDNVVTDANAKVVESHGENGWMVPDATVTTYTPCGCSKLRQVS